MRTVTIETVRKAGIVSGALLLAAASAGAAPLTARSAEAGTTAESTRPAQARADEPRADESRADESRADDLRAVATGSSRITLITGDEVVYQTLPDGTYEATVEFDPDSGTQSVHAFRDPTGVYVIPDQAQALVAAGVLDRELFDVEYLAENGYADTASAGLPVIVTFEDSPQAATPRSASTLLREAHALPATSDHVALWSIDAAAVTVDKESAQSFWHQVSGPVDLTGRAGESQPSTRQQPTLASGIAKVWLDRRFEPDLDRSVPHIGAPHAWDLGYDGTGVEVAVLDSGIDATHPDLAGKVVDSKNFVADQDVTDDHGHGTHVASTIAGVGAASDGMYTGVAPGAELLVGKVCTATGGCPTSALIAGMEWAVAEGARVINVSIGGGASDGTDPTSQAVDQLSASSGALFVISAGNDGPGASTVGSPGAADAALTVGAVDKADQLAGFSSRGPRTGDAAIKPDVVGPGVDIVAARAAETAMEGAGHVGEHYTTVSGTSMAAPHVAGAAAILAQQHPDWSGEQLKAALMSTAHDLGSSPYEQGAGRVDVARVVEQHVVATTTSADFGVREWPHDSGTETRTVTYRNLGSAPVTLQLDLSVTDEDGAGAPAGVFGLSDESVTVPVGGTADVEVRLTESSDVVGLFGGRLTATDGDGTVVTTAVGVELEPEMFHVRVELTYPEDSTHQCLGGYLGVLDDLEDAQYYRHVPVVDECAAATFEVPAGRYMIDTGGIPNYYDAQGRAINAIGVVPEVAVSEDTELTIDLAQAQPLKVEAPHDTEVGAQMVGFNRVTADGYTFNSFTVSVPWISYVATTTEPATTGYFELFHQPTLIHPTIEMDVVEPAPMTISPTYFGRAERAMLDGTGRARLVFVGAGEEADFADRDVRGAIVLARAEDTDLATLVGIAARAEQAGALAMLQFADGPHQVTVGESYLLPVMAISREEGNRLAELAGRGPVEVSYVGTATTPYTYTAKIYYPGRVPDSLMSVLGPDDVAEIDSRYHAEADGRASTVAHVGGPHDVGSFVAGVEFEVPTQRTDYYGPLDPELRWNRWYSSSRTWIDFDTFVDPGPAGTESWDLPAAVPGVSRIPADVPAHAHPLMPPACTACRHGDQLSLYFRTTNGLDGQFTVGDWPVYTNTLPGYQDLSIEVDGEEVPVEWVPRPGIPGLGSAPLPIPSVDLPARADVVVHHRLNFDVIPGWSNIDTTWGFTSTRSDEGTDAYQCIGAGATCRPESMIFLDYDMSELALDNTTVAEHAFGFAVEPHHQVGAESDITEVTAQVSFDDGASWQRISAEPQGDGTYRFVVQHPPLERTSGAVSVRITARDDHGGSVEQTLERIYELAPDACPAGSGEATVVFGDQDSGVPNAHRGDGCTFLDLVWAEAPFSGHGQFIRVVRGLVDEWRHDGLLDRRQAQLITMAAARSGIGQG